MCFDLKDAVLQSTRTEMKTKLGNQGLVSIPIDKNFLSPFKLKLSNFTAFLVERCLFHSQERLSIKW